MTNSLPQPTHSNLSAEESSGKSRGGGDLIEGQSTRYVSDEKALWIGGLLFLVVLAVFLPAVTNDFVNFDDQDYVTANPRVQRGLTVENVWWAFGTFEAANWQPLTWLSHMADCQIFGVAPWGHHLTNVLLHALNACLVFAVLRKLTGSTGRSLTVAALFGLHPLHVESVAWISERKDVLSTLFFLLSLWAYAGWTRQCATKNVRARFCYGLTLVCFALGLMSKPMVVTLPFVLMLLDYWPLRRVSFSQPNRGATFLALGWEKIPFFALSLVTGIVTWVAQGSGGAFHAMGGLPFLDRVANALVSYAAYLGKFLCPLDLALFYQHPGTWPVLTVVFAGALLLGITWYAVSERERQASFLVGWLWYGGTLVPVIGLIQIGMQARADRYTYIPSLGFFIMLVWAVQRGTARWRHQASILGVTAALGLTGCAILTVRQIGHWANSETLFRHATLVTKNNWVMQNNLGQTILGDPARTPEAIGHFEAALRAKPDFAEAHNNLGNVLAAQPHRTAEAIRHYQTALRITPQFAEAHNNLGNALANGAGPAGEAIAEYKLALKFKPAYAEAHNNLGRVLARDPERRSEAIAHLATAITIRSDYAEAHFNLGNALAALPGRLPGAIAEYRSALNFKPDYADAHFNLANALAGLPGRAADAIAEYQEALRLSPANAEAHNNLGAVLAKRPDQRDDAIRHFEAALRIRPAMPNARFNLAVALLSDPAQRERAIGHLEEIVRVQPDFAPAIELRARLRRDLP